MEKEISARMGDESAEHVLATKTEHLSFRMERFEPSVVPQVGEIPIEIEVPVEAPMGKRAVADFQNALKRLFIGNREIGMAVSPESFRCAEGLDQGIAVIEAVCMEQLLARERVDLDRVMPGTSGSRYQVFFGTVPDLESGHAEDCGIPWSFFNAHRRSCDG